MTIEQSFTIDSLDIVPDNSTCYIQCPSIDNASDIRELFVTSEFIYNNKIILTIENKQKLKDIIRNESIVEYFHNLTIKQDDTILLEAYDGMVYGVFSNKLSIPKSFLDKYLPTEHAAVSDKW